MKDRILKLAASAIVLALVACGGGGNDSGGVPVAGVTISPAALSLTFPGAAGGLTATVAPGNASNKNVAWESSNAAVANVEGTGANGLGATVTPVAVGTATITATTEDGAKTATCAIQVTAAVTGVTLSRDTLALTLPGSAGGLTATVLPAEANKDVTWTVAPAGVVGVAASGGLNATVTAVGVGAATITVASAADPGKKAECRVTVTALVPVTGLALDHDTLTLTVDAAAGSLTASITPADATNDGVNWINSNPNAATISATSGSTIAVTAVKAGSSVITAASAADPTKKAECHVTVLPAYEPVMGVTISPDTLSLAVGSARTLTATTVPPNATNQTMTWHNGNPNAVDMTVAGATVTINAIARGASDITVTTQDGPHTATCVVTVTEAGEPIMYVAGNFGLYVDGTFDAAINGEDVSEVVVDAGWVVHAAGWHYDPLAPFPWWPAYYRNGERFVLHMTADGAKEGGCYGMTVTDDGRVYIAGRELAGDNSYVARLWVDGEQQFLEGAGEPNPNGRTHSTFAHAVRVRDGHVYVCGGSEDADYIERCTIWKDGQKHQFPGIAGQFYHMVIDAEGGIYAHASSVYKIAPDLSSSERVTLSPSGTVLNISVDGTDFYAAGWSGDDAYYWKNGARVGLPRHAGAEWTDACAIYALDGHVYVAGRRYMSDGTYWIQLWKDGQIIGDDDAVAIKDSLDDYGEAKPATLFVK